MRPQSSSLRSLATAALVIGFAFLAVSTLPAATTNQVFSITSAWRYQQSANLDATAWKTPAYDDLTWPSGNGLFGLESCGCLPVAISTPLTVSAGQPTYYFRRHFNFTGSSNGVALLFSMLLDDGAVVYLNGTEVQRIGMAGGPVTYASYATRSVDNATTYDGFLLSGSQLASLVAGDNVLAVEVHQINSGSSDIVFGCTLSTVTNLTGSITRGPYLQSGSPTNVIVRWRTDLASDSKVWIGTNLANLDQTTTQPAVTGEHEVNVTGLLPNTRYYYSIGNSLGVAAGGTTNHFFITSPLPGASKPTRVWVLGDSGTASPNQVAVRNAYETFTGTNHTDIWLMLGDNAYNNGLDNEYQAAVFNIYTNMLRKSVLWPTLGNHDTAGSTVSNVTYPYFSIFSLTKNAEAGGLASGSEHYYSFDYGNIHFICLDSMTVSKATNGPMANWLRADLADTTADWIVAFFHHPPYTKGSHNSDSTSDSAGALVAMRENFLPILEAGGVDLVLAGHSHSYERSYLLTGHYGYSTSLSATNKLDAGSGREGGTGAYKKPSGGPGANPGAVYAVAGSSGQTEGGSLNHPAFFLSTNQLGSMVLDFNGPRLDAKFIRENGQVTDYFTMLKTNDAPVATNLNVAFFGDTSTNLQLTAGDPTGDPLTYSTNSLPTRGVLVNFSPAAGTVTYAPAHGFSGNDGFTFRASDGQATSAPATVSLNVLPLPDLDGDGLPDAWETAFGLTNALADADGDGMSNVAEYFANTNPTNAASYLRIIDSDQNPSGHTILTWNAIGGTRYRISFSSIAPGPYIDITLPAAVEINAAPVGSATTQSFTDNFTLTGGPPPNGQRYYRLRIVQ